jgi:ribosomal protein S18 acetylase RimI-like enzyme
MVLPTLWGKPEFAKIFLHFYVEEPMEIRRATKADVPSIAALAAGFRDHLGRSVPSDAQFAGSIARLLDSEDAEFCLGLEGDVPVGYVLLRYRHSMWAAGTEATLEDLYVDPEARGAGAGRALVEAALGMARERPCTSVCLDTNENNAASTAIYAKLGFNAFSKRWNGRQVFYRVNLQNTL